MYAIRSYYGPCRYPGWRSCRNPRYRITSYNVCYTKLLRESLCIGQDWDDDVRVVLFVRLREGLELDDELQARIRKVIRENATPRHVPARIVQVSDIPRTISGKIVELAVRNVVHGRPVKNVDALANPKALDLFRDLPELQS